MFGFAAAVYATAAAPSSLNAGNSPPLAQCENFRVAANTASPEPTAAPTNPAVLAPGLNAGSDAGLRCLFQSDDFAAAIRNAAAFQTKSGGKVTAGVVPHHLAAQTLISGFLSLASRNAPGGTYDTVVIVAPNHDGDIAGIILSNKNWDYDGGVACDTDMENAVLGLRSNFDVAENDARMEEDHSASTMIPFIHYYLPKAKVAPILVSRTMSLDDTLNFAQSLYELINASGKRVLLLCSIDFSHYLNPERALANGAQTLLAVQNRNYAMIHGFSNNYVDSPASLILFLRYLDLTGAGLDILDHTDASAFLGGGIDETTSYFIMAGENLSPSSDIHASRLLHPDGK